MAKATPYMREKAAKSGAQCFSKDPKSDIFLLNLVKKIVFTVIVELCSYGPRCNESPTVTDFKYDS